MLAEQLLISPHVQRLAVDMSAHSGTCALGTPMVAVGKIVAIVTAAVGSYRHSGTHRVAVSPQRISHSLDRWLCVVALCTKEVGRKHVPAAKV